MKYTAQLLGIILITFLLLFFTARFAVSDFTNPDPTVFVEKPWRPYARLVFGGVCVPIVIFFVGWFCKSLYRSRRQ
jgi:hypothetical protein